MSPLVSIGIPAFNAEKTLPATLTSVFQQTFSDYEILVSDNASTDRTAEICRKTKAERKQMQYVRKESNCGAFQNFRDVLKQATGKYFMWLGADDLISENFLKCNVEKLEADHNKAIASAGWNLHPHPLYQGKKIGFSCCGTKFQRLSALLSNIYDSHAIFYSIIRREVIIKFPFGERGFPAWDWAVDVHLAAWGDIQRSEEANIIFGQGGMSLRDDGWRLFQSSSLDRLLPLGRFSIFFIKQLSGIALPRKIQLLAQLFRLNQRVWHDLRNSSRYGQG